MTLDAEQMQQIILDEVLEKPQSVKGKEAREFRKDILSDIELAKEKGWVIDIPPEWEMNKLKEGEEE